MSDPRESLRTDILELQKRIKKLLRSPDDRSSTIDEARNRIIKSAVTLLRMDPNYYMSNEISQTLWKECFYRNIEQLRANIESSEENREKYINFLNESINFYGGLFSDVLAKPTIESSGHNSETIVLTESTKYACLYSLLIQLGDLERYREQAKPTEPKDYSKAEMLYKQAIYVDPSNGNGHNQLAVISTYKEASVIVLYRYCRALACRTPFPIAYKNAKSLFARNAKEREEERSSIKFTNKRTVLQAFILDFVRLQQIIYNKDSETEFKSILNDTLCALSYLLGFDYASTPLLFRVIVILIFAAEDMWAIHSQPDQPVAIDLTYTSVLGWTALYAIIARVMKYTMVAPKPGRSSQSSTKHIAALSAFVRWLCLQKSEGFRPRYLTSTLKTGQTPLHIQMFLSCEHTFWLQFTQLMNRLPNVNHMAASENYALPYEIELRGFSPFGDMYNKLHIISEAEAATKSTECEIRYIRNMQRDWEGMICDSRIQVKVTKIDDQYVMQMSQDTLAFFSGVSVDPSDSFMSNFYNTSQMSVDVEDEEPYYMHSLGSLGVPFRRNSSMSNSSGGRVSPLQQVPARSTSDQRHVS